MKSSLFVSLILLISIVDMSPFSLVVANEDTGTIQGKITLNTPAPALPQIVTDKTVEFCGTTLIDPVLIVQENGVKGAVVSLEWQGEIPTKEEGPPSASLKKSSVPVSTTHPSHPGRGLPSVEQWR